ncbi:hypothetical protein JOF56_002966 [Kibdelosporangium banguiense]|uniref:34 kDa antigenic protein n=1 Tax=Kibdelosporangium banguiense TaxID=1365924 RepID=A0ABS4TE02_9PSEU|nr:DUF5336 domain-containing protein [Kibdelosporangium banguiense]MBP2322581.1 hypothetical protein [Kibdelosporangium banguiense]
MSLPQILALVAGGLGVLNLFLGFAPLITGSSFYESGVGAWIPAVLLIGGLLQLPAILPGDDKPGLAPAAVTTGGTLAFLFMVFAFPASLAAGGVMVLIFGILQMGAAVAAYLYEIGILKPPAPNPYGAAPGPGYQPGFPPSGAFPAQPQPGQPPQAPPTQQHPQPGQFGTPPPGGPGQQTQFAPQQGQFGTPPGTPPGGYPQQQPPQGL